MLESVVELFVFPIASAFKNFGRRQLFILTMTSLVSSLIFNKYVDKFIRRKLFRLQKERGIDILQINNLLTFGVSSYQCEGHMPGEFECGNLDCNYGKISYMLHFIDNCKETLDVCIFIITAKLFGDCIIRARQRGVRVRVITDSDMLLAPKSLIPDFMALNIQTRQKKSQFLMHHKFVIIDNEILINGSMNFTMTGAFFNWENVLITSQRELVESFQETFNNLWEDFHPGKFHPGLQST